MGVKVIGRGVQGGGVMDECGSQHRGIWMAMKVIGRGVYGGGVGG